MKKRHLLKHFTLVILVIIVVSLAALLVGYASENSGDLVELQESPANEKNAEVRPIDFTDNEYLRSSGKQVVAISFYQGASPIKNMVEESGVIVRGKVVGFDYISIRSVNGAIVPHTDYIVEIYDVLRGEPVSNVLTVRVQGGENGETIFVNTDLSLAVGEEFVFFLFQPGCGSGWNTEGDYYKIIGGNSGLFKYGSDPANSGQDSAAPETVYRYNNSEVLDYQSLVETIMHYDKQYPVDKNYTYNMALKGLTENLESGFITQEEYDMWVAELEIYAVIVE